MCSPDSLPVVLHLTPTTLSSLPKCGLPSVFQLYPLAFLNLKPSTLMGCKAGLIVSGSPYVFLYLSPSPGVRLSGCLSSLVSLHQFPALASGVSHSGQCCLAPRLSLFTCLPSCVSHSGRLVSGCLLFSLGSHSYVSPSGDVLFLLHHDIIFDWSHLISVLYFLCVFLLSQELHQHRLQIATTWKTRYLWFMLFSIEMD